MGHIISLNLVNWADPSPCCAWPFATGDAFCSMGGGTAPATTTRQLFNNILCTVRATVWYSEEWRNKLTEAYTAVYIVGISTIDTVPFLYWKGDLIEFFACSDDLKRYIKTSHIGPCFVTILTMRITLGHFLVAKSRSLIGPTRRARGCPRRSFATGDAFCVMDGSKAPSPPAPATMTRRGEMVRANPLLRQLLLRTEVPELIGVVIPKLVYVSFCYGFQNLILFY